MSNARNIANYANDDGISGNKIDGGTISSSALDTTVTMSANHPAIKSALNASGAAPIYACRAWINFDGNAGTIGTGRNRGNCDSVSDHGTGEYTINFTNEMPTADYAVALSTNGNSTDAHNSYAAYFYDNTRRTTSGVRIVTTSPSGTHLNNYVITVAVFC